MKKIIRKNTFETNSSSSHSLVITKSTEVEKDIDDLYLCNDGVLYLWERDLDFYRNPDVPLTTFRKKLGYLIAAYRYDEEKINEIVEVVKKVIPDCKGVKFPQRSEYVWYEPTNVGKGNYYGDIDHQSDGILKDYLESNNISFEEFLTNKKYIIILDGDEYGMWETFKESGLINEDFIEKEIGIYD